MSVLKLSYDHLPSNLKQCFAYCSLFPKDHWFSKQELIYVWMAQGYIEPNNKESNFMHLLRRGFFQQAKKDDFGEIQSCKMHDIMHDLAIYVAGEESIMLSGTSSNTSSCTRHVNLVVYSDRGESLAIPAPLLNVKWLRSCMLMKVGSICSPTNLDQLFTDFKLLRTLSLSGIGIENIPPSIGELKLMRYLDLSYNNFEELPDSMTNLVNLLALDLMCCSQLKVCPQKFQKLTSLTYFNIEMCIGMKQMPVGIGELTSLQYLSDLKVGKGSGLDALAGLLQQLRGKLLIDLRDCIEEEDWDGDECSWKLPVSLQQLVIWWYPGIRIPDWGKNGIGRTNNLARLELRWCVKVKYLPPLRCLPNLRWLLLEELREIEFLEDGSIQNNVSSIILPRLEELSMQSLPKLKGWWREVVTVPPQLPLLSQLSIYSCPELELKSFPLCPHLRSLQLDTVDDNTTVIQQELPSAIFCSSTCPPLEHITIRHCKWLSKFQDRAFASLRCLEINKCCSLKSLHVASPQLRKIEISWCDELMDFELVKGAITSVRVLKIRGCKQLKTLQIAAHLNVGLEKLIITDCPELELWKLHLDWDSFSNLNMLHLCPLPSLKKLPHCIRHRQALGLLEIVNMRLKPWSDSDDEYLESEHSSEEEA